MTDQSPDTVPLGPDATCLVGGGDMGALIRAHDWAATPFGALAVWPQALRSAVQLCLNTPIVSAVHWGPDLRILYNDAYAPALAERHPWALGRAFGEVWAEIWDVLGPQIAAVLETGRGFSTEHQLLRMKRNGRFEDTYWIYSFAPLHDRRRGRRRLRHGARHDGPGRGRAAPARGATTAAADAAPDARLCRDAIRARPRLLLRE